MKEVLCSFIMNGNEIKSCVLDDVVRASEVLDEMCGEYDMLRVYCKNIQAVGVRKKNNIVRAITLNGEVVEAYINIYCKARLMILRGSVDADAMFPRRYDIIEFVETEPGLLVPVGGEI